MKRILIAALIAGISSSAAAQSVGITLAEWKVTATRDTVHAGAVTFRVQNAGTMSHGFYVSGPGVEKGTKEIPAGQTGSLTVTLKPGTYEVYCPLADMTHKAAGMSRKITVLPADAAPPAKKPGDR